MVQDFVENTPWSNREEKVTIQAFHKLVWHLECPRAKVPFIYQILKVMKKNKSIYKLLGCGVCIMKNMGRDAPLGLREMASYVHWHMAYRMSINHVFLRGLVNPDKPVELTQLLDGDGDLKENIVTMVWEIMTKHPVDHLPLWQGIFQNNDGSWRGFDSNGKRCKRHKGSATKWSDGVAAHLQFHLLKWGVTNDSALALIWKSSIPQALGDAIQATFKNRKVVSATQAEMQDEFAEAQCHAPWVDIICGMEASERLEYEQELWGCASLLDPSNPEALNFNKKQSFKSFGTAGTNASMFTAAHLVSLGGTAYESQGESDVDSQESDIFYQQGG